MPHCLDPLKKNQPAPSFTELTEPVASIIGDAPPLEARGNRDLQLTFEQQLNSLIFFHLEEHTSGRHLLQVMAEDTWARECIAPPQGIKKSSYFEAINSRGLEQLLYVFEKLQAKATRYLPKKHENWGDLVAIDGSLIDAVLSMLWADYRDGAKKAKAHLGFDLNHSIPAKVFLTDGKGDERPFVDQILSPGQTGVMDRYYQCHKNFDQWQTADKHFVCRIKARTRKTVIQVNEVSGQCPVFYDAVVLLGTPHRNQTQRNVRVVGYRIGDAEYWLATDRHDLPAEDLASIYKLRWQIEIFFGWWKGHLKVYHLIARSRYGLMVQILGGLITYLLLAIYCRKHHQEKVSLKRVRELRIKIQNEARALAPHFPRYDALNEPKPASTYAKT
jgi:hypothetical protein